MFCRAVVFALFVAVPTVHACTYCDPANQRLQTFRQEARTSKFIIIGTLTNPRLVGDNGFTDVAIEEVVKSDPALGKAGTITLPRWTPVDPKKPVRLMVFCDVFEGKVDPFRGVTLRGAGMPAYMKGALALDDRDRVASLLYYFNHIDSSDPEVAADAFLEFAKASDQEIGAAGPKLDPAKLRKLLGDPKTPPERLGVFAFLLGACGTKADANALAAMIDKSDERTASALSGLLGGLIEMRPEDGWKRAVAIVDDPKRPYQDKLAVLGTLRFFHAFRPVEHRKAIVAGMAAIVSHGDMADMAIEDLRRWQWWDQTRHILAQYKQPTHAAPLVKNAILRYAICSPDLDSAAFVKAVTVAEPALVKEIRESLEFERPAPAKKQ
ncbi:MAG TPA: hypothetical protein VHR66_14865 [Gemmataceae bacterium]|jgi:hypothetical protein|nr:hypothetical protein [Gemmataceae bacterium]